MLLEPVQKGKHAGLWCPFQRCVVDVLQPESCADARCPFEVVEHGPAKCSCHVDFIIHDRRQDVIKVALFTN